MNVGQLIRDILTLLIRIWLFGQYRQCFTLIINLFTSACRSTLSSTLLCFILLIVILLSSLRGVMFTSACRSTLSSTLSSTLLCFILLIVILLSSLRGVMFTSACRSTLLCFILLIVILLSSLRGVSVNNYRLSVSHNAEQSGTKQNGSSSTCYFSDTITLLFILYNKILLFQQNPSRQLK